VEDYIYEMVSNQFISGISVGVSYKGSNEVLVAGSNQFGGNATPINDHTLFDIASLTKVVSTTTLILKMVEEGFFSLNTPLIELLPDVRFSEINIKQILTHTSGIIHDDKAYRKLHTKQELRDLIMKEDLAYEPGTKVVYSDLAFILLGFIIEKYFGDIETAAAEYIFKPLHMEHTCYCPLEKGYERNQIMATEVQKTDRGLIQGEVHDGKAHLLQGKSGNAGIFSTAEDLLKFGNMLLSGDSKVLSRSSKKLLHQSYTEGLMENRTLGWLRNDESCAFGDYASTDCLFHTGFTGTSIYVDFEREVVIVLLTNAVHPARENPNISRIRHVTHNLILKEIDY
jgi:CubicO group peptidase (beta-lactamase class C family)